MPHSDRCSLYCRADVVTYSYDDTGRLTAANYPNGADAAENLTARTVTTANSSARKPVPKTGPASSEKPQKTAGKAPREKK